MTNIPPLNPTPFIIEKSIMKYPLRNPVPKVEKKHRNLPLVITKKYSQLHEQYEKSSKDKILKGLGQELKDAHDFKVQSLMNPSTEDYEKDLTKTAQMHLREMRKNNPHLMKTEKPTSIDRMKVKMEIEGSKEKMLRGYIYENITPRTLKKVYSTYRLKLLKDELKQLNLNEIRQPGTLSHINTNSDINDYLKDHFLSLTLQEEKIDVGRIAGLSDIKRNKIEPTSQHEVTKEDSANIFLTKVALPVKTDEEEEEEHLIRIFNDDQMHKRDLFAKLGSQQHKVANYMDKKNTYTMYKTLTNKLDKKKLREQREQNDTESTNQNSVATTRGEKKSLILDRKYSDGQQRNIITKSRDSSPSISQFSKTPVTIGKIVTTELRKIFPQTSRQTKKVLRKGSKDSGRDGSPPLGDYSPERIQPKRMELPRTKSCDKVTVRVRDLVRDSVREVSPAGKGDLESFAASLILQQDLPFDSSENNRGSMPSVAAKNIRGSKQGSMDGLCLSNFSPSLCASTNLTSNREVRESPLPTLQRKLTSRLIKEPMDSAKDSGFLSQGRMTRIKLGVNVEEFFRRAEEMYEHNKEETRELKQILDVGQRCMSRDYSKINRSYNSKPNYTSDTFREFKQQQDFKKKLVTKLVDSIVNKEEVYDAMHKHEYFNETPGLPQKAPFRLSEGNDEIVLP